MKKITYRKDKRYYFDKNIMKEIIYPEELHFTEVLPDDPVENYINDCILYFPDLLKIEIKKI